MKHFIWYLAIQLAGAVLFAQEYKPVDQGSAVKFKVKNLGFNTEGSFSGLQGKISFDAKDPAKGSFEVSVDAATVNTDNNMRDGHLKKEGYFDVEKYPRISFVSTAIAVADKSGHYKVTGKLTIKGKTREITIPFIAQLMGDDYIFNGEFTIDRRDFDIGGSSTISNNVTINMTVLAKKE